MCTGILVAVVAVVPVVAGTAVVTVVVAVAVVVSLHQLKSPPLGRSKLAEVITKVTDTIRPYLQDDGDVGSSLRLERHAPALAGAPQLAPLYGRSRRCG